MDVGMRSFAVAVLMLSLLDPGLGRATPAPDFDQGGLELYQGRRDTTKERSADWLPLPFASYTPATKVAVGVVLGYYGPAPPDQAPSRMELTLKGTQRRQIVAKLEPELYLKNGQWRVEGELRASEYPDFFYGIGGDTPAENEEEYTARYGTVDLVAQRRLGNSLRVGPRLFGRIGTVTEPESGGRIDRGMVPGARGGVNVGGGFSALWDTRDSVYYPHTGTYGEGVATWYSGAWGSDHTFGHLKTDLRGYRSVGPGVAAAQAYAGATVGTAPFQLLPRLGGNDRMRGYREGRFRDRVYWTVQAEYRVPLLWRLKAAAFGAIGETGPGLGAELMNEVEATVGLGGRFRFTDDGLHGRLDVAYSRTGLEFYIALGEAF